MYVFAPSPLMRGRTLLRRLLLMGGAALLALCALAMPARAAVPNPTVIGPIPNTSAVGDPSHGYPFFSTGFDIYSQGYTEQEFFFSGTANTYNTTGPLGTTATILSSGNPYETRMVVRRPTDPKKFNGTVVVEWYNVSAGNDSESDWMQGWKEFVRDGYAWVGISAQMVGVNALKAWSPRYSALDVTDGGLITNDALSYDIFSQGMQAIKYPEGVNPMGNLQVKRVIADGESQSAGRLTTYYNTIQPLAGVADGFILHSGISPLRTDLTAPVFKLDSETDVVGNARAGAQPDSPVLATWDTAGDAHADFFMIGNSTVPGSPGLDAVTYRDLGVPIPESCTSPPLTRVPFKYVYDSAVVHMNDWIKYGTRPPSAPPIVLSGSGSTLAIVRDSNGIAEGGIRLAEVAVPTALNSSINSGPGFCFLFGTYQPFDAAKLASLYPNHGSYVSQVDQVTQGNVKDGYILAPDAQETMVAAAHSTIGK